jgi:NAD(P)-dependent dehydrogenase (short-subunit alcohol dehydrogenase family)
VLKEGTFNVGSFELIALDLADLESVRRCADALPAKGEPFDVIIANAGVIATPFRHTADGFEMQFGINHLGHFVLVNRIAPLVREGVWSTSPLPGAASPTSTLKIPTL